MTCSSDTRRHEYRPEQDGIKLVELAFDLLGQLRVVRTQGQSQRLSVTFHLTELSDHDAGVE